MCSKIQGSNVSKLVGYTYPKLHKGKEWYVDFYALDPATDTMRRKKYSISTEFRVAERSRRATEIINVVSSKLMKGWNPWVQTDNSRAYVLFEDAWKGISIMSTVWSRKSACHCRSPLLFGLLVGLPCDDRSGNIFTLCVLCDSRQRKQWAQHYRSASSRLMPLGR